MIKESVVVKADPGFDGRPIALLVQEASQYASTVYIQVGEKHINAKSIMGIPPEYVSKKLDLTFKLRVYFFRPRKK